MRAGHRRGRIRPSLATALALLAIVAGLLSTFVGITGDVDVGLVADDPGGVVLAVTAHRPAWDAGIRPGQRVVAVASSDSTGGWAIETSDGSRVFSLTAAEASVGLRMAGALAGAGLLLAILALRDARLRPRRSELSSSLALVLAAAPALAVGTGVPGVAVVALAGAAPLAWIGRWAGGARLRAAAIPIALVWAATGALAWAAKLGGAGLVGDAWAGAVGLSAVVALALGAGVTRDRIVHAARAATALDAVVAAGVVLVAALLTVLGVPALWSAAACVLPVLLYASARGPARRVVDRVLLADLREQAAIRATEEERARMAREIHDDPLQAIAGVIQRLEGASPDTESARESLREVATRLRGVATELHPPILDDLGLGPAIEAAARTTGGAVGVAVRIEDRTGYGADGRPPADVELAAFRVIQEAVANAVRHSGGSTVVVSGIVSADAVRIEVIDDGRGISDGEVDLALRQGHLGLSSMRQRAAAVGAVLEVGRAAAVGRGTRVAFSWPA